MPRMSWASVHTTLARCDMARLDKCEECMAWPVECVALRQQSTNTAHARVSSFLSANKTNTICLQTPLPIPGGLVLVELD